MAEKPKEEAEVRYIVRIANTDLNGQRDTITALRKIKGVSYALANAVCIVAGIDKKSKLGSLPNEDIAKLEKAVTSAHESLPTWMLNRRRNIEDNSDKHLVTTDLTFSQESDLRTMKKIKSYKGVRHMFGAPVRGQRTRSNFRRNKGKALGVAKSKKGKTG